jgi:His/Glu/Gln/Arg/opine family amino acid ABC transporter permease subunit
MILVEIKNCLVENYVLLFIGLKNTVFIWVLSAIISISFGFFWGLYREKRLFSWYIIKIFDILAYIIQGIPLYLQLLIMFFVIAPFFNIHNAIFIGIMSLGICSSAYTSQIIKTSLQAIPDDQWNLMRGLGYPKWYGVYYVILPQMIPHVIPLFINECDQLLKSISVLSTLGILDFTRSGLNIINVTFKPIPIYIILLLVFLFCSLTLRYIVYLYNEKMKKENEQL